MFLVGLTGGIATGKSTVSGILLELGCSIIDADEVAREVVRPGRPAWIRIKREFGESVFQEDGEVDREKLGQLVFSDSTKRQLLNSIVHPQVYKATLYRLFKLFITGHKYVILDVPLLFESGKMLPYMTSTVVVVCTDEQQLNRLMTRNSFNESEAQQRIAAQMPLEEKVKRATHVISNTGSRAETEAQVKELHRKLESSSAHWKIRIVMASCFAALIALVSYIVR